jgi:hypothetical protein
VKAGLNGFECCKKVDLPKSDRITVTVRIDNGGVYFIRGLLQDGCQLLRGQTGLVGEKDRGCAGSDGDRSGRAAKAIGVESVNATALGLSGVMPMPVSETSQVKMLWSPPSEGATMAT